MNEEHVAIVKAGSEAIANWRKGQDDERLQLAGASLDGAYLRGADLSGAMLRDASLTRADLSEADLSRAFLDKVNLFEATLTGADLSRALMCDARLTDSRLNGADLSGATLRESDFCKTDLTKANLTDANLMLVDLRGANLREANLSGAKLNGAIFNRTSLDRTNFSKARVGSTLFVDVDLSDAFGLEDLEHFGPSEISIDTLYKSGSRISEAFLRDCGVPEDLIAYIPSFVGQPFQHYSAFISYSHKNEDFAKRLHSRMRDEKLRVWYAPEDMKAGQKMHEQIDEAICTHDKLLIVLSEESMTSKWVATEIRRALRAEKRDDRQKLFPIRLCSIDAIREWECFDGDSGQDMAVEIREYHIPDFSNWKDHDALEEAFGRLLEDLRESEEQPGD